MMKRKPLIPALLAALSLAACTSSPDARYLDLNTGEYVTMKKDSATGLMVNSQTGQPVDIYVDNQTHDTIWGAKGTVVNGKVNHKGTHWVVVDESSNAAMDGTNSATTDGVSSDAKVKTDENETKIKDGDYKKKVEKDGDVKIQTGDKTIKIDGETGERKVKKDKHIGDKLKKIF